MIRIVLADDEALVRGGMRLVLEAEPDFRVVGEAATGLEAIDEVVRNSPDVAVIDVRMPEMDGLEATRRLRQRAPGTRVVVVTTFHLDEYVLEALRAGAAGFLLKEAAPESLADAIRAAASGDSLLSPSVTRRLIEHFVARPEPDADLLRRIAELTDREREVMRLVARGLTNAEIAAELYLGEGTVKSHLTSILGKLELRNRAQVVVAAYESGVVRVGEGSGTGIGSSASSDQPPGSAAPARTRPA
jgi:DNA-binding NarL/FixJ family response regulator